MTYDQKNVIFRSYVKYINLLQIGVIKMKLTDEPTMHQIDDYHNNESQEKRRTVRLIIVGLLIFSVIYGMIKFQNDTVSDYIGSQEAPGITLTRH